MTPEELNRINAEHYAQRQAAEEQRIAEKLERAAKLAAAGLGDDPAFQADVDVEAALLSEAQAQVDAEAGERAAARAVLDKMDMERQALDEAAQDAIHTRQSAAGSKKGQADRLKVLELWDNEWKGKRETTGPFAQWAFARLGGEYSAAGEKAGGAPTDRTIRKWINESRLRK